MGFDISNSVPVITVLIQGFLSFFSPCVLPLLPIYIGYLSGGTTAVDSSGAIVYSRKKVLVNTVFFVIGIAAAFFILGLGLRTVGRFFSGNQMLFARIGGIIVIVFGLFQLGLIGRGGFLDRERRLPFKLNRLAMSPITALIMGFVFSFAWTPCVGPTLSGVLLMASSAGNEVMGFLLIGVYTAGFVVPFLLTGIFTTSLLSLFKRHGNIVKYTAKIGGVLLIFMGIMMLTGLMNNFTGYLSRISGDVRTESASEKDTVIKQTASDATNASNDTGAPPVSSDSSAVSDTPATIGNPTDTNTPAAPNAPAATVVPADASTATDVPTVEDGSVASDNPTAKDIPAAADIPNAKDVPPAADSTTAKDVPAATEEPAAEDSPEAADVFPAPDFLLADQFGEMHSLADYRGKIIFLNFWGTWCPPCRAEMPFIQELYEEAQADPNSDLVILGVAFPNIGKETSEEDIRAFLEQNGYTYPVLMDTDASLMYQYYITAYPTTFMIDPDGNIYGYLTGGMTKDIMESIIRQTRDGSK